MKQLEDNDDYNNDEKLKIIIIINNNNNNNKRIIIRNLFLICLHFSNSALTPLLKLFTLFTLSSLFLLLYLFYTIFVVIFELQFHFNISLYSCYLLYFALLFFTWKLNWKRYKIGKLPLIIILNIFKWTKLFYYSYILSLYCTLFAKHLLCTKFDEIRIKTNEILYIDWETIR